MGTREGLVQVHSAATGEAICRPLQHGGEILHLEFNSDGTRLATVSVDNFLRIWELPAGREKAKAFNESFWRARFSPDGKNLLVVSRRQGKAQLHDAETLAPVGYSFRHDNYVADAVFSPDGERVATASYDHTARIWNVKTGESISAPLQHPNDALCLCFSPDGRMLATGGAEPAARIWDTATGKPLTPWLRHGGQINGLSFSPSGRHLLTSSRDGTARLWPVPDFKAEIKRLTNQPLPILRAVFSDDGKLLFALSKHRGRGWRVNDLQPLTPELRLDETVDYIRFGPDGQRLLTGSRDHMLRVWKFDSAQPIASYKHSSNITAVSWMPDSKHVFSASEDGDIVLWDAADGRVLKAFRYGPPGDHRVAVSPDARWLAGSSGDRIVVWSADGFERVWASETPRGSISVFRFSPDSRWLVSGDNTGGVRVQRSATGEFATPSIQHAASIQDIRFTPDSKMFCVASHDMTARIWSPSDGRPLTRPLRLANAVVGVAFSPNGRWLAINDGMSFQVWDARSGVPVSLIQSAQAELVGGAFLDNHRFGGITESGLFPEYRLEMLTWPPDKAVKAMELLSGMMIDANGEPSPGPPAGTDFSRARQKEEKATWQWAKEKLELMSKKR